MGKALKTVGMVVGAAVLIATGVGALAGVNIAAMGISTLTGSLTVGQLGTLASGVAAVGGALDKPKSSGAGSPTDWTSNPDQPTPFLFGRMGIAGKIVHQDEFGPDDNMYKALVGILSGVGPIKGIIGFKGDDQPVTFDAHGKAVTSQWKDEMWMQYRLGNQPDTALTSPPGLKAGATLPAWGLSHKLSGKACYMQTLAENSKGSAYQWREPNPIHEAEGIAGWDPRYDDTYPGGMGPCRFGVRVTYRYITDPIIAGLNWSLGLVENGRVVGGIGASREGVDIDSFVQAANVSEANEWIIAAWPDTSEDVSQVLGQMLQAGGATRSRDGGRISCVTRGAVLPSVVTVTEADLAGPLELDTGATLFNRLNTITPKFLSEQHKWTHVPGTPVSFPDLVAEDGREHADLIEYRFVPVAKQAAELAALDILDAREPFSGTVHLKPHMRRLKPGSRFTFSAPGLLLDGVKCMVLGRSYTARTGEVRISFRSETDGKVALALGKTTSLPAFPNLSPTDPRLVTEPGFGEWTAAPRPTTDDGIALPIVDVAGAVNSTTATGVIFEWGFSPAPGEVPDPIPTGQTLSDYIAWNDVGLFTPNTTAVPVQGPPPGRMIYVAVRNVRGQNFSSRLLLGPILVPGQRPPIPTGVNVTSAVLPPDAAGLQTSVVVANWAPIDLAIFKDLDGYDTEYVEAGQPPLIRTTRSASDKWQQAQPGISYTVRVRSRNKAGAVSDWAEPVATIGAGDTTVPSPPTGLSATGAIGGAALSWANASAADLASVEIWESDSGTSGTATRLATVEATPGAPGSFARTGLSSGDVRYYWLKSADHSGNVSGFSASASVTVPGVPVGEIDTTPPGVPTGLSITSSVANGPTGTPVATVVASWSAVTASDLAGYDLEVTESGGGPVVVVLGGTRREWQGVSGRTYTVRVRSYDRAGNRSAWSGSAAVVAAADGVAPSAPTGLTHTASVNSAFLRWTNPNDSDLATVEIWENTTADNPGAATRIATVNAEPAKAGGYARTGLTTGAQRWYWVKAVDTSGNASGFSSGTYVVVPAVQNADIAVGSLTGDRLTANTVEGSVFRTTTSLPGTITVGNTGVSIGTVQSRADDPLARAAEKTTLLGPGFIRLTGSTTLAAWQNGPDSTEINGGVVAANTIRANSIAVGLRGVQTVGFNFVANPDTNTVSWSSGDVIYTNDAGAGAQISAGAGSAQWTSGRLYLYVQRGVSGIYTTTSRGSIDEAEQIILATYAGGLALDATYGRTIIDGQGIRAGSFTGDRFSTTTNLPATITVGTTGVQIGVVESRASNPAARINAGTTQIDPGRVLVAASTSLESWYPTVNQAVTRVAAIDSDNVLTPVEKPELMRFVAEVNSTYQAFVDAATAVGGVSTQLSAYGTAINQLNTYVGGLSPAYDNVSVDTPVNGPTLRARLTGVTNAQSALLTAMQARDLAARINAASTTILPGRILIQGATTLDGWRTGTEINGGAIAADTVTAREILVSSLSAITANLGTVTAGTLQNAAATFLLSLTNGEETSFIGSGGVAYRGNAIGSSSDQIYLWIGPSSVSRANANKSNAWLGLSMTSANGGRFFGTDAPTGGGDVEVTLPNDFGQVRSGSGLSALGPGWQTIASASLSGVVPGQVVTGTISLGGTFGEAIVGNMRMLAGGSLVAGPVTVEIYSDLGSGPQHATVTGQAVGGGTQTFQIQIENGSFGGSAIGDWSIARIASASPTNPGYMSAQQAEQLANLVAGGGGGSGAPLATTAPPAIGAASAVGTGTSAARNDHTHAHGNQAGGSLHALATTSTSGFMSPTDKVRVDAALTNGMDAAAAVGTVAQGSVRLIPGSGASTGYVDFLRPTTIERMGFIGVGAGNQLEIGADSTYFWNFNRTPTVAGQPVYHGGNLGAATTSAAGTMSAADKSKLNGIAAGATANSTESINGTANTLARRTTNGALRIGNQLRFDTSSNVVINSYSGQTYLEINATEVYAGQFIGTSDQSEKTNVTTLTDGLSIVRSLRPVRFDWKRNLTSSVGFIAQEVEAHLPTVVHDGPNGRKGLDYSALAAPLASAVQALDRRGDTLQAQIDALTRQLTQLQSQLPTLN